MPKKDRSDQKNGNTGNGSDGTKTDQDQLTEEQKKEKQRQEDMQNSVLNAVKSWLGDKLPGAESLSIANERIGGLEKKFDELLTVIQAGGFTSDTSSSNTDTGDAEFVTKSQVKDLAKTIAQEILQNREKELTEYERSYISQIKKLSEGQDPKIHETICKEIEINFNVRHSNSGIADAKINYANATLALLKKGEGIQNLTGKENPLKGKQNDLPLGTGADGEVKDEGNSEKDAVQLDDYARDYIKKTGMKEEKVKEALKKGLPLNIGLARLATQR